MVQERGGGGGLLPNFGRGVWCPSVSPSIPCFRSDPKFDTDEGIHPKQLFVCVFFSNRLLTLFYQYFSFYLCPTMCQSATGLYSSFFQNLIPYFRPDPFPVSFAYTIIEKGFQLLTVFKPHF